GEDYDWGLEMIARNYKITVDPKFNVYHCHGEGFAPFFWKHLMYSKIKRSLKRFKRPRRSFTAVFESRICFYDL
nr:hypothetical protein [Candidatus Baldrarchaeota archaeon]